jgi:hypothetical protein
VIKYLYYIFLWGLLIIHLHYMECNVVNVLHITFKVKVHSRNLTGKEIDIGFYKINV